MASTKTPDNVSKAIKKLAAGDQVIVQTYIAKLKASIVEAEANHSTAAVEEEEDDGGHAHFHGHDKCTSDHGHDSHAHDSHEEHGHKEESGGCSHDHDHSAHHGHDDHGHDGHGHGDHADDDTPAWKKRDADPTAAPFGGSWGGESHVDATAHAEADEGVEVETPFPALYDASTSVNDDTDKAMGFKAEASDLKGAGDYDAAVDKYTLAVTAAPPSALLYANRADCLLRMSRPRAAMRDCDEAVRMNPDSAKALRIRGKAKKSVGEYEGARKDLSASQSIDFDDGAAEDLKFVSEKVMEVESKRVQERLKEEDKLKKRLEERKKAQEEAKKAAQAEKAAESARAAPPMGGMPGMGGGMPGMGGGMPGMGGMGGMAGLMSTLMSDPELAAGMSNPKIMGAFSELMSQPGGAMGLMSNPAKMQELMSDPEIGPFMQKIMGKLGGGGMPGMGGMGGGMPGMGGMGGGMPGMGGMGGGMPGAGDDMPDLDEIPDLDMD